MPYAFLRRTLPCPPPAPAAPLAAQGQWPAVKRDKALEAKLHALASEVQGDVGIYVRHLKSGRGAVLRADELFPTASMIKVPILVTLFDRMEQGALRVRHNADMERLAALRRRGRSLRQVARWRQGSARAGLADDDHHLGQRRLALAAGDRGPAPPSIGWLAANGFDSTRMNSRTPGASGESRRDGMGPDHAARDRRTGGAHS